MATKKSKSKKKTTKKKTTKKKVTKKTASKKAVSKKATTKKKVAKKASAKKKVVAKKKTTTKKVPKKASSKKTTTSKATSESPKKINVKAKKEEVKTAPKTTSTTKPKDTAKIAQELSSVVKEKASSILLTDAEGRTLCRYPNCDQVSVVEGYCRYHYLLHWKKIQLRKKILSEGKLDKYVQELTSRYPDKFIDILLKDLATDKDFIQICHDIGIIGQDGDEGIDDSFSPDTEMSNEGF